jgi:uncharacterized protein DUF3568
MSVSRTVARGANAVLLALLAGVAVGGCAVAAPLISASITAAPMFGGRSVDRTVGADMQDAWAAVETALQDTAFHVESRERTEAEWTLRAVAGGVTVSARLEHVTPKLTRVTLRVEAGSLLPDRKTADVIHDHILKVLDTATRATVSTSGGASQAEALRSLETEVRRLRTDIGDGRSVGRPQTDGAAANPAPVLRVEPSAIVTVPLSAALPTVSGPVPPTSVIQPAGVMTPMAPHGPVVEQRLPVVAIDRMAPLRPADALVPVRPANAPGSGL